MSEKASEKGDDTVLYENSLLTDDDLYLFNQGSHFRLYEKLGAQPILPSGPLMPKNLGGFLTGYIKSPRPSLY
jgi:hypothetical protein